DVLSGPPRSATCSAIRSLARRIHAERPSMPGRNEVPLVILDRPEFLTGDTRGVPACDSKRPSDTVSAHSRKAGQNPGFCYPNVTPEPVVVSKHARSARVIGVCRVCLRANQAPKRGGWRPRGGAEFGRGVGEQRSRGWRAGR